MIRYDGPATISLGGKVIAEGHISVSTTADDTLRFLPSVQREVVIRAEIVATPEQRAEFTAALNERAREAREQFWEQHRYWWQLLGFLARLPVLAGRS